MIERTNEINMFSLEDLAAVLWDVHEKGKVRIFGKENDSSLKENLRRGFMQ